MILYKYLNSKTAELVIKNPTVKFSKSSSFNDPLELTSIYYDIEKPDNDRAINLIAASESYGILSLTRNPLNPLMWAHYASGKKILRKDAIELDSQNNSHAGMVIGIDANLAGFNCSGSNVIPAKFGSVIYTATKPTTIYEHSRNNLLYNGLQFNFDPEILEALQRTFLYKSFHWSYEEEVRVVRNIGRTKQEKLIQSIDKNSIKEIYIGIRNAGNIDYLKKMARRIKKHLPLCTVFVCTYDDTSWDLTKETIDQTIEELTMASNMIHS
ncbi:DUF2971 domain-containing protein [Lonsdalea quercina]|uniref:DUF2971 domain-containing protein n=1 Tax=Lonsdalea quercina TaxID=71657 RepID=UPI0039761665